MASDVILNKIQVIERCLIRINEEYASDPSNLNNFTRQDSIVLNIQRACEASIDIAMHLIAIKKLGLPQSSRDAFEILHSNGIIDDKIKATMQAMVGFRNVAVHDYQTLSLEILKNILEHRLGDFKAYSTVILEYI